MRHIRALRSLQANLSDLVENGSQSSPLVLAWGATASSHVSVQIEQSRRGITPGFVEFLSEVAPRSGPVEDLLNKIREQEFIISSFLNS